MRRPICRSALWPASSMKVERSILTTKSTTIAITTPIVSATSESIACAGRMRSYTTMMKIEVVSARMLVSTAASATCMYDQRFCASAPQNQCRAPCPLPIGSAALARRPLPVRVRTAIATPL